MHDNIKKEIFKTFKKNQIITFAELYGSYYSITGYSLSNFYNFVSEMSALGFIERQPKKKFKILKVFD